MRLLGVLVLVLSGIQRPADEPNIESQLQSIRSLYREATDAGRFDDTRYSISLDRILPVTGLQTTDITFSYANQPDETSSDPYSIESWVRLVVVEYNVSVHVEYHIEYLFDENGLLRCCFRHEHMTHDGATPSEQRYYFSEDGSLIRATGDFGAMEGNRVESRQGRSISPEIHDGADDIRRTALVDRRDVRPTYRACRDKTACSSRGRRELRRVGLAAL